jgi:ribosome-associated protein
MSDSILGGSVSSIDPAAPPTVNVPPEVQLIVDALDDKRARDVVVLRLEEVSDALDWFVVASGDGPLQLQALEDAVFERLKATGLHPKGIEGPSTRWVLMDYVKVVVHVMSPEARAFYDLEGLWADAPRVSVTPR